MNHVAQMAVIARFLRDEERWLCDTCIGRLMGVEGGRISDFTRRMARAQRYFAKTRRIGCAECGTLCHPCTRALTRDFM